MQIGPTSIRDTFAEAFEMKFARLLITAHDEQWLQAAIQETTGYGSSVIGCDAEAGIEARLLPNETPDGRVGAALLIFGFSGDALQSAITNRVGQCVMTCPTTAVFDGFPNAEKSLAVGKHLRFFGDGFQKSKIIGDTRYWRVPVMDGEFLVVDKVGVGKGVAGGNLIIEAEETGVGLAAASRAAEAIRNAPGVMSPFPGGVVRSGSKVGSQYKALSASTADAYCPTLRGRVESKLDPKTNCVYELVIDGIDEAAIRQAMTAAMNVAAGEGVVAIGAGNYGGKLGRYHIHLRELVTGAS